MRRPNAFTIVELLVVISIIALLLTMLLPALSQARTVTLDLRCKATLRGLMQATNSYSTDMHQWTTHGPNSSWYGLSTGFNRDWYQTGNNFGFTSPQIAGQTWSECSMGQLMVLSYLPEKKDALGCPQADFREATGYNDPVNAPTFNNNQSFILGLDPDSGGYYQHNGSPLRSNYTIRGPQMNMEMLHYNPDFPGYNGSSNDYDSSPITSPTKMAFYADHEQCSQWLIIGNLVSIVPGTSPEPYWSRVHEKGFNVGYLDGHVRLFEDQSRAVMWGDGSGSAGYYGSGWSMKFMDEQ